MLDSLASLLILLNFQKICSTFSPDLKFVEDRKFGCNNGDQIAFVDGIHCAFAATTFCKDQRMSNNRGTCAHFKFRIEVDSSVLVQTNTETNLDVTVGLIWKPTRRLSNLYLFHYHPLHSKLSWESGNETEAETLQEDRNKLSRWSEDWQMLFNIV